jgi:transketolase
MQVEGHTDKIVAMDPVGEKFAAFGWNALDVDGNSMAALIGALEAARAEKGRPTLIVANTVAGSGVPFLEGQLSHLARLTPEDAARALAVLETAP